MTGDVETNKFKFNYSYTGATIESTIAFPYNTLEVYVKYIFSLLLLLTTFSITIATANSSGLVPFGHQVFQIQNYSRATDKIAISGLIGDGGVKALASHGFKTIIDMRTSTEGTAEEKALVNTTTMNYINIPMTVSGISEEQLSEFTKAFESAETPILIHCGSGNRAGAMWAAYLIRKGTDPEKAIEAGRKAGMRPPLEEKIRASFLTNSTQ